MRFGFVTCVQLGLSCMEAIYDVGGRLDLAITLEDDLATDKSGRIHLDDFSQRHSIDLVKIRNINEARAVDAVKAHALDWMFIIGWSQIARQELLAAPRYGVLGMHPTLLPEGRGRAAIPWAILKGLGKTGVTMFKLDGGVDTGPILGQREIPLHPSTDATALYAAVDAAHVALMRETFPRLNEGIVALLPQDDGKASEWPARRPEDGRIDLAGSVLDAERLVRAVTRPYPGAFADVAGQRLVVWRATVSSQAPQSPDSGPFLQFRDGVLNCIEWEFRQIGSSEPQDSSADASRTRKRVDQD